MAACIIYHSETGNTRLVAEFAAKSTGASLIAVKDCASYNAITRYLVGARCARRGERAIIEPSVIDVSTYDGIVVGSPVWAWHPTPAINAAIAAFRGCEGKNGVVFATSGGMPGDTLLMMKGGLEARGVRVDQMVHFTRKELTDTQKLERLVASINAMSGASPR